MDNLQLRQVPVVKAGMLIRKHVTEVFEALIKPDISTKFWFTKSGDRLKAGKQVQWDWEKMWWHLVPGQRESASLGSFRTLS